MKNNRTIPHEESTYALLVRSEEKERSLSETFIYALLIGGAIFAIWQAAHQPISLPVSATPVSTPIVQTAEVQQPTV